MQKIIPCLWFEYNAEEAMNFYSSVFKNTKVKEIARYGKEGPLPEGTVLTITMEIEGQEFMALNGGPYTHFTPAISFLVNCESQAEVDTLWDRLLEGGEAEQCGWLKDKFGLSWQIVPTELSEMMKDKDPEKVSRVTRAMFQMVKLDLAALRKAYQGG